jgi:DNA polymerase III epsilon subunit-like protein
MNLVFDIETDGLLDDVTRVHCIGIYDLDAKETYVFNDQGDQQPITRGIQMLEDASSLVGHNIIGYDIPVLKHLYPWFTAPPVIDTLVISRIIHSDILAVDNKRKWKTMPVQLYGRHSLEAYGHRLGEYKGCFGKDTDWKEWSPEMQEYMLQDVVVTTKLWHHFTKKFLTT